MKYNPHRYNCPIVTRFLDMCSMTTPHGTESYCWRNIPGRMTVDKFDNVHVFVGHSRTMFASHLDTACSKSERVWFDFQHKGGVVGTNGRTVLGADDKAGATIMCRMIERRVPGWYVFFAGEEQGCIGSSALASAWAKDADVGLALPDVGSIDRCISFDRRGYDSIVTRQMGSRCCSDVFAQELADALHLGMEPDPSGVFTDSAQFTGLIAECTNISVGYHNQHSTSETQDLDFLRLLADRCTRLDWDQFSTVREPMDEPEDFWWGRGYSVSSYSHDGETKEKDTTVEYDSYDDWVREDFVHGCREDGHDREEARELLTYEGMDADEIERLITLVYGD